MVLLYGYMGSVQTAALLLQHAPAACPARCTAVPVRAYLSCMAHSGARAFLLGQCKPGFLWQQCSLYPPPAAMEAAFKFVDFQRAPP
jgi:hypothetical protein